MMPRELYTLREKIQRSEWSPKDSQKRPQNNHRELRKPSLDVKIISELK